MGADKKKERKILKRESLKFVFKVILVFIHTYRL